MTLLCVSPNCRLPGRHTDDCTDPECRGCHPARAADGLQLCLHCGDRIATDAVKAAATDPALLLALTPTGEPGARGDHGGLTLSDAAVEARTNLRAVLTSWCRMIAEERGITLPHDGQPMTLGAYVATHARWLAAHPAAADASAEMADLARSCYAAAYPSDTRIIHIGACPALVDGEPCEGQIRALLRREASLLPSAVACDTVAEHAWTPDQWRALGRHMAQRVVART